MISAEKKARLLAFYLPQFHPIPENNAWWGDGFTEWTNVAKARPMFRGHYQPHLPADLGFYDLRVPEVREAQADLARGAGIEGFCYWHYWFAGKRLLERPFNEVISSGKPDFPFCVAWANATWSGVWHGSPDRILIEQTYPGPEDHTRHFNELLPAFRDPRYIRVDGKPLFLVYRPFELPAARQFVDLWQGLARQNGLPGLYILGLSHSDWHYDQVGFDGVVLNNFAIIRHRLILGQRSIPIKILHRLLRRDPVALWYSLTKRPRRFSYAQYTQVGLQPIDHVKSEYPLVLSSFDNTPRSGHRGLILDGATPELFQAHLQDAVDQLSVRPPNKRLIFLQAWNEWAEGNHLEPDQKYGHRYLDAVRACVM